MIKIYSGIQPSGRMHLGNYIGAISIWLKLQNQYKNETMFSIADLHSLTVRSALPGRRENILECAKLLLSCGIDPDKALLVRQSKIPQHANLAWIFSCITPFSWCKKMNQWKVKSNCDDPNENSNVGLLTYPILQAADVLLYCAERVPVGSDQLQHLELIRDIARKFNQTFQTNMLTSPQPFLLDCAGKSSIMSLCNGQKKMSKSDPYDSSRINLLDTPNEISMKIKKAATDSVPSIYFDFCNRPHVSNLLSIFAHLQQNDLWDTNSDSTAEATENSYPAKHLMAINEISEKYNENSFSIFKEDLAKLLIERLEPIRENYHKRWKNQSEIIEILEESERKAKSIAEHNWTKISEIVGII